ncbi:MULTISPECIES: NAD(P)/FAD-dependent oxidoreductase [unclassified Enterococcus]|uniref:NAD(P)/FAD-dependent oxidoreductase n=1 Tax=unclassified Enterococcus TaxID=2608891 RepID=UPI001553E2B2|nr:MULTISPECIES: NAD(P)/FAD-dependent oxidoreductase [unclassified Enterococcus]MBS7577437.1 NAD(P)/FAD-dependent oxidoreductase [Enterococcus sp. MMGLQ5-2]MBS7584844.1 NAD(P)/FAD-dependent oxidoreductase [Enterococcus sp. MMGLQ5-1]NPD12699.1 NAD(P)/FAD-dependent oxidoreductase [Enterococcus sp. MMGLQ5-1]NPD37271.1 NAD(P)/FAD-dependent oxidoreductase [Enterococcus sp. MMGLQ5-2]
MNSKLYDVIVIGGGTSGMLAAYSAAQNGASVLLLEKNKRLGKKLRLTGGGRCNVTNAKSPEEVLQHIPGNGKFLYSAFSQFNNYDIIQLFTENGVELKEEDHGRLFPTTNRSKTIVETLERLLTQAKVNIFYEASVSKILVNQANQVGGVKLTDQQEIYGRAVVIATGGKTYRYTGSTGDGYELAKRLGHTITKLYPTEVPLLSEDGFIKKNALQGLSLQDVALSVLNNKQKKLTTQRLDLLFTHFGLSGPATLRCSSTVVKLLEKQDLVTVSLDIFPDQAPSEIEAFLVQNALDQAPKSIKNGLRLWLPERLLAYLLNQSSLSIEQPIQQVTQKQWQQLAQLVKAFKMSINGTWPLDKAFVTGGGISLKEINPKTMESKLIDGLYFCGEILDINGYTGGYNITAAFSTGFVAGKNAATI